MTRLDMLIAGYENQFNESLRYWRTRFLVIPADEVPQSSIGPTGEKLNDEEIRLLGMDKLAELFTKVRWVSPEDKGKPIPPVRFLPTDFHHILHSRHVEVHPAVHREAFYRCAMP